MRIEFERISKNRVSQTDKQPAFTPGSPWKGECRLLWKGKLSGFLAEIGFRSRPISPETSEAKIRNRAKHADLPPQRFLLWEDNEGFEYDVVVSIESGALYLRYYQEENDLFGIWEEFRGEVDLEKIKKAIRSAVTRKDVIIRVGYFWPERVQTGEGLNSILANIGFTSHETRRSERLPSAGESVNAPHRLLLAQEHNLETDDLVSVEQLTIHIYYSGPVTGVFHEWAKLTAEKDYASIGWADSFGKKDRERIRASLIPELKYSILYNAITSAMTGKKETRMFKG